MMKLIPFLSLVVLIFFNIIYSCASSGELNINKTKTVDKTLSEIGIGLNGVSDWSTQLPLIDLMKQSRNWHDWINKIDGFILDKHGWIKELKPNQTAGTVFLVNSDKYSSYLTKAIVFYEGDGELIYTGSRKIINESKYGRDVINLAKGNNFLHIQKTNPDNPLRNIKIIPLKFLDEFKQGHIFNPDFLKKIDDFDVLRFMDWLNTNNSNQKNWDDRSKLNDRSWAIKGVPLEIAIKLSNLKNIKPWFNLPHLSTEIYQKKFAEMIKANLNDNLDFYIEYSNETWNWGFKQASYSHDQALKNFNYNFYNNDVFARFEWQGMKAAKLCDLFKLKVFNSNPSRVKCVLSAQTVNFEAAKFLFECPAWSMSDGGCYKHGIDYLAITSYFHGGLSGHYSNKKFNKYIIDMANSPDGIDVAFEHLIKGKDYSESLGYKFKGIYDELNATFGRWNEITSKYGVKLITYEGGQHIVGNNHDLINNKTVQDFYKRVNEDPRMADIYKNIQSIWQKNNGGLHVYFVDIAAPSKWGSWGALEHVSQETSPKWSAIKSFKH